jgi:hypothetical protein
MKCEVKNLGLLQKVLTRFMTEHAKVVVGDRAVIVSFKKGKFSQVEINIQQRKKLIALSISEQYPTSVTQGN